jgi:hypothetical protein
MHEATGKDQKLGTQWQLACPKNENSEHETDIGMNRDE